MARVKVDYKIRVEDVASKKPGPLFRTIALSLLETPPTTQDQTRRRTEKAGSLSIKQGRGGGRKKEGSHGPT